MFRRLLSPVPLLAGGLGVSSLLLLHSKAESIRSSFQVQAEGSPLRDNESEKPPNRREMVNLLKGLQRDGSKSSDSTDFDVLIIGGGATGAGCAVDAASRGLKAACVERDDFSSGTSSRSTKLVHGGVRYLEKAVRELDIEQYKLVREALHERSVFLKISPYLAHQLPIMLPIYEWWKVPYYWAGSKLYDLFAGSEGLESSYFLSKTKALNSFPMLKTKDLVGAMVYYDGAHNDSRMNIALILTAIRHGATIANHTEVVSLIKIPSSDPEKPPQISGALVRDLESGEEYSIKCKGVINATGPFTDGIRKLDDETISTIVAPSSGVHIILPNYYAPAHMGLVDPSTSDGRVIFFLPWQGHTIAGTTDSPTIVTANPIPEEKDIEWILKEVQEYLSSDVKVRRGDVLSAWSGIRPLVRDPLAANTASLVRNHMINVSPSGLLTIAGGKWTTYRAMAQETIDKAIDVFALKPTGPCVTTRLPLVGTVNWSNTMYIKLVQHFGVETEVAKHLSESYGDRAWAVMSLANSTGNRWPVLGARLVAYYPYIEAEVRYACRREYACTVVDVIARRTRLAFLNAQAAFDSLDRVSEIMAEELGWDVRRRNEEIKSAKEFLLTMGLPKDIYEGKQTALLGNPEDSRFMRSRFSPEELAKYRMMFSELDRDGNGAISLSDLQIVVHRATAHGAADKLVKALDDDDLKEIIQEVDMNRNGEVEFGEFLQVLGAVKDVKEKTKMEKFFKDMQVLQDKS